MSGFVIHSHRLFKSPKISLQSAASHSREFLTESFALALKSGLMLCLDFLFGVTHRRRVLACGVMSHHTREPCYLGLQEIPCPELYTHAPCLVIGKEYAQQRLADSDPKVLFQACEVT